MRELDESERTFHWITPDRIVAGLWDNGGVRHYAAFQRVENFAPVEGSSKVVSSTLFK